MHLTRRMALALMSSPLISGGTAPIPEEATALEATVEWRTPAENKSVPHLPKAGRILFQGDSITDGGRGRNPDPNHIFGQDYAYLIAAHCGAHYPAQNWTFLNRGVSGNKVTDLADRWGEDTLALKPDLLSILIGVNDATSAVFSREGSGGVTVAQYEQTYDALLQQTRTALPQIRFVLCESFILPVGRVKEHLDAYETDLRKRREVVHRLATKYRAPVVPFQKMFTDACKLAPAEYWIWDGVHPTAAGHQLMADLWLQMVNRSYSAS